MTNPLVQFYIRETILKAAELGHHTYIEERKRIENLTPTKPGCMYETREYAVTCSCGWHDTDLYDGDKLVFRHCNERVNKELM
jgi:hypothetical protein